MFGNVKSFRMWVLCRKQAHEMSGAYVAAHPGSVPLGKMIEYLFLGYVGLMFILAIAPSIESAVSGTTITNTVTLHFLDIVVWVFPVIGIVILILAGVRYISMGTGRGR